jgi:DNA-binding transcriptional LysR family regulator
MSLSSLYLDAFYTCARAGNFTKASDQLAITQSALSQRIKNLEEELRITLFIRDRAGIKLTEAGQELLRYCQKKDSLEIEAIKQLKNPAHKGLNGIVRVGGYSSVMKSAVLSALAPLVEKHPAIKIYFLSREMHELPGLLKNGEIDFMFIDHQIERGDLLIKKVGIERNIIIQKKNYSGPDIFLDHDEADQTTRKYFAKFKPKFKFERSFYDDSYGIIEAVKLGLGKAVIPYHLVIDDKDLQVIDKDSQMQNSVYLHYYKQDFYTKLQEAVLSALEDQCRRILK